MIVVLKGGGYFPTNGEQVFGYLGTGRGSVGSNRRISLLSLYLLLLIPYPRD